MAALLYLVLVVVVGDTVARPMLAAAARPRRFATAFLAGLAVMTWATYLVASAFSSAPDPLDRADLVVLAAAGVIAAARVGWVVLHRGWRGREAEGHLLVGASRTERLDWIVLAAITVLVGWMTGQTYWYSNGTLHIAGMVWSDFGPTTAIAQSFALGSNFPTEYPHFPGLPILYHFLYSFQVGNLTRLGFDPAFANNVLSVLSTASMLALVMALGRLLFRSAAVGRIAAGLFFLHGSLSWVGWVAKAQGSLVDAVWSKTDFLASGFPWRGEEWAVWSQATFLNQRHLTSAIGILLVGVYFVLERHEAWRVARAAARAAARQGELLEEELAGRRAIERIRGDRPMPRPDAPSQGSSEAIPASPARLAAVPGAPSAAVVGAPLDGPAILAPEIESDGQAAAGLAGADAAAGSDPGPSTIAASESGTEEEEADPWAPVPRVRRSGPHEPDRLAAAAPSDDPGSDASPPPADLLPVADLRPEKDVDGQVADPWAPVARGARAGRETAAMTTPGAPQSRAAAGDEAIVRAETAVPASEAQPDRAVGEGVVGQVSPAAEPARSAQPAPSPAPAPVAAEQARLALPAERGPLARALDALDEVAIGFQDRTRHPVRYLAAGLADTHLLGYVVVGFLLGTLPMWNSAVFLAAAVVFAVLFLFLPNRPQMVAVAIAAGSVALPQVLALRPTGLPDAGAYPQIHLGFTIEQPTIANVASYLAFIFGPKLLLAVLALIAASGFQRVVFLAFTALVGVAFGLQFGVEAFANHKFLNIWLLIVNLFAAAGLVRLWFIAGLPGPRVLTVVARLTGRAIAIVLVAVVAAGGLLDLMPIKNTGTIGIAMQGDRLFDWVTSKTRPSDIFLTDLYVTHPILLAGRRIYFGWPYYAWSLGYPVTAREERYKEILGATDGQEAVRVLQQEHISYVAIDDAMRTRGAVPFLNEPLLAAALGVPVFTDPDNKYQHLVIYAVPGAIAPAPAPGGGSTPPSGGASTQAPTGPATTMFRGGLGSGLGQFRGPRGIAVAPSGEVLVADSENHRIQRFSATGDWLASYGAEGKQPGQFNQPNGVAVDARGHIFVADTLNHRLQEFDASFKFVSEWYGPPTPFYGPRDVAIGADGTVFVLDQGRARVVSRAPNGTVREFGSFGKGDGQLAGPTGFAVTSDRVYVADTDNSRIVVFDLAGKLMATWPIQEWRGNAIKYPDVVVAPNGQRLFASSMSTNEVMVLNLDGRRTGSLVPTPPDVLAGPAAMALRPDGRIYVVNFVSLKVSLLDAAP